MNLNKSLYLFFFMSFLVGGCKEDSSDENTEVLALNSVSQAWASNQGGIRITLTGNGFADGDLVTFAGIPAKEVQFVSNTQLEVVIPAKPNAKGKVEVSVKSPEGQVVTRSDLFGYTYSQLSAAAKSLSISGDPDPIAIAFGDFDNDGKADVVLVLAGEENFSLYLGKKKNDSGFQRSSLVDVGIGAVSKDSIRLIAADVNGDDQLDLVATSNVLDQVILLPGKGDGTFKTGISLKTDKEPMTPFTADINGDGKLDVVVPNKGGNSLSIFLNNGTDFGFTTDPKNPTVEKRISLPMGTGPIAVSTADFNQDHKPDFMIVNNITNNTTVLLGNGDGTIKNTEVIDLKGAKEPVAVTIADLNGDQKLDAIIANSGSKNIIPLFGRGDGTFTTLDALNTTYSAQTINTLDLNGDEVVDLIVGTTLNIEVFMNQGDGRFLPALSWGNFNEQQSARTLWLFDENGDGNTDIWFGRMGVTQDGMTLKGDISFLQNTSQ